MILGKIMMIQNSSPVDSVDYLISKKTIELKARIKDYSLNDFISEIGISKTSMVRYLKNINIYKFSYFKNIMYEEYMHAEVDLYAIKQHMQLSLSKEELMICRKIDVCKRIIILGDGNRFSLLIFQKALTYLGHSCEIPVYLGSEETVIDEHNLTEDDLVIIISLHESYNHFCTNRSIFYRDARYLEVKTKARIGFIGVLDAFKNENLYFEYEINKEAFEHRISELQNIFTKITGYLLKYCEDY